jgi:uncharacterized delta-60 repeat protein
LDPKFGGDGIVTTATYSGDDTAYEVLVQPDGKIVATGRGKDFTVVRYLPDGRLDPAFGRGGTVTTKVGTLGVRGAGAAALQPDGRIIVAGGSHAAGDDFTLVRYLSNGALDLSFGRRGVVQTDFAQNDERIEDVVLQADGKIVAAGWTRTLPGALYRFALARYLPNGSLDTSFGTGGKVVTALSQGYDQAYGVALQPDGKIVLAGYSTGVAAARYNPDGTLDTAPDTGFGPVVDATTGARAGFVIIPVGDLPQARDVAIQPDGRIVAAGFTVQPGSQDHDFVLVRYTPDGGLDPTWNGTGIVTTDFLPGTQDGVDAALGVSVLADGKILAAGAAAGRFALARYNPDGTLDAGFGTGGLVATAIGGGAGGEALAIQPADGKIVVAGGSDGNFTVARYLSDGSPVLASLGPSAGRTASPAAACPPADGLFSSPGPTTKRLVAPVGGSPTRRAGTRPVSPGPVAIAADVAARLAFAPTQDAVGDRLAPELALS